MMESLTSMKSLLLEETIQANEGNQSTVHDDDELHHPQAKAIFQ